MGEHSRQSWFEQVDLDDPNAVQRAIREVMERALEKKIGYKKACEMLFKLQDAVVKMVTPADSSPWLRHDSE